MEPQIPMSKITTEAEWLGKMLLKLKDVKTEEDLKNFKGLGLLLKSLIAIYNNREANKIASLFCCDFF